MKRNGYDLLVIDYRTFGKSTGPLSMEGIYLDAEAGWQYLNVAQVRAWRRVRHACLQYAVR